MTKRLDDSNLMQLNESNGETELQRLQKQLRKMDMERIAFIRDKKAKQLKKDKIIATLAAEQKKLQESLKSIQEGPHAKKCRELDMVINKQMYKKEELERDVKEQNQILWELHENIRSMEKKIDKLRSSQITEKNYKEKIQKGQRNIHKLENQLDVLSKRYDEVISEISNLRQSIDHMLLDRTNFNNMWQKMVNKLEQGKKYIIELIDQSTAAYDQREELCNKIQELKEKNLVESSVHMQDMRELQRKLDHDAKLQQFFSIKGQHRANAAMESRTAHKKLLKQNQLEKKIDDYWKLLDNIKLLSSEDDITKFEAFYSKQQEENFALFNYVNELCYEVKHLGESVQKVEDDLETQKGESDMKKSAQQDTIDNLEKENEFYKQQVIAAEADLADDTNTLNELLTGIAMIFKSLPKADIPILELLGTEKGITINNVKLFVGIIKRQINYLINVINSTDQGSRILMKKPRTPKFNIKT